MKANHKAFSLIIGILAALLIFAPSASTLARQPAAAPVQSLNREGSRPQSLTVTVVPAAAFHSDGYSPFGDTFFSFAGGYIRGGTNDYGCVETGVVLPDDVYIAEVYASVYDNDPDDNHSINLLRKARTTGQVAYMANLQTSGASTSIQSLYETNIRYAITANPEYAYYITDCLSSSDVRLYSVRIWYEPDYGYIVVPRINLPAIFK
jgi:hypothetical protein